MKFAEFEEEIAVHDPKMSVADVFLTGWCSSLAVALGREIPEGEPVSVMDYRHDNGSSWVIHAGLRVGNAVVDIEGVHDLDVWTERWSELSVGDDCELVSGVHGGETDAWGDVYAKRIAARIASSLADSLVVDLDTVPKVS